MVRAGMLSQRLVPRWRRGAWHALSHAIVVETKRDNRDPEEGPLRRVETRRTHGETHGEMAV